MNLLINPITQLPQLPLHLLHKALHIPLHLLGREAQLPNRHANHPQPLSVLAAPHHPPHAPRHVLDDRAQLHARHQALGSEDPAELGFVELRAAVGVADAAVEFYALGFDGGDDAVFADEGGAGFEGLLCEFGISVSFLPIEGWKHQMGRLSN